MIRVAVADDSAFTCRLLASYLECAGDCEVVGTAHDAASTLDLVQTAEPDVLTLDLEMPGSNGLELLRRIVRDSSAAVVVVSGVTRRAAATTLRALELGAVDFVLKYTPGAPVSPATLRREIVSKVKIAATVPQRRRAAAALVAGGTPAQGTRSAKEARDRRAGAAVDHPRAGVIVIGASTGGPAALRDLVAQLPADYRVPCVIVQHLPAAFTAAFAAELGRYSRLPVREVQANGRLEAGSLLVSPGARHLLLRPGGRLELRPTSEDEAYRPSIDFAMVSAAESYGRATVGVVLSGMGSDGAEGLRRIRAHGGTAYVQEPSSCVIDSMPTHAIRRAGADCVATPDVLGSILAMRGQMS